MKHRLMTPGPTAVPEEALLELALPVRYHRTAEARQILAEVHVGLQHVFATTHPVCTLTASGTGAMEAAFASVVPAGRKIIACVAGRFGERWLKLAQAFGVEAVVVSAPWGRAVAPAQLADALAQHPDAVAVCATLSETSTGVRHDLAGFGALVAKTPAVLIVDAVSGLGAMECRTEAWGLDFVCTGSQKALMMPPGLAFVSVSPKGEAAIAANPQRRTFYLDLGKALASLKTFDTPWTSAHTLVRALRVCLRRLVDEGIENVWRRQERVAAAARAGFGAVGMRTFPDPPNPALTVACVSPGVDGVKLLERLEKGYGFKLAGGQDQLKGKVVRLGHIGHVDEFDLLSALAGVERALHDLGEKVIWGSALSAAQRVLAKGNDE